MNGGAATPLMESRNRVYLLSPPDSHGAFVHCGHGFHRSVLHRGLLRVMGGGERGRGVLRHEEGMSGRRTVYITERVVVVVVDLRYKSLVVVVDLSYKSLVVIVDLRYRSLVVIVDLRYKSLVVVVDLRYKSLVVVVDLRYKSLVVVVDLRYKSLVVVVDLRYKSLVVVVDIFCNIVLVSWWKSAILQSQRDRFVAIAVASYSSKPHLMAFCR